MTAVVVEWARRWLGVTEVEARLQRLTLELRRTQVEVEQLRANIAAAERVAAQGGDDVVSRVLAVLRRGR